LIDDDLGVLGNITLLAVSVKHSLEGGKQVLIRFPHQLREILAESLGGLFQVVMRHLCKQVVDLTREN